MNYFNIIMSVIYFYAFAYDMENHRSMWTWGWLFIAIINLGFFFANLIVDRLKDK